MNDEGGGPFTARHCIQSNYMGGLVILSALRSGNGPEKQR